MIKLIETSAGVIFTKHIVRIDSVGGGGCHIFTVDGVGVRVAETYANILFQICNNRKPEENEL